MNFFFWNMKEIFGSFKHFSLKRKHQVLDLYDPAKVMLKIFKIWLMISIIVLFKIMNLDWNGVISSNISICRASFQPGRISSQWVSSFWTLFRITKSDIMTSERIINLSVWLKIYLWPNTLNTLQFHRLAINKINSFRRSKSLQKGVQDLA